MQSGINLISLSSVDSTNNYARGLLMKGDVPPRTVVSAAFQTGGRGQSGNMWESEPDSNLLVSMILYPESIRPEEQFSISMVVSSGVMNMLSRYISGVKIKWPNDLYAGNDKIAGILIENAIAGESIVHSIAGIGINVNQKRFLSDAPNPVSLSILTGKEYNTGELLDELIESVTSCYNTAIRGGREDLIKQYHSSLWRMNEWHYFRTKEGTFKGMIVGTDRLGCLMVRDENGVTFNYAFKEIEYQI